MRLRQLGAWMLVAALAIGTVDAQQGPRKRKPAKRKKAKTTAVTKPMPVDTPRLGTIQPMPDPAAVPMDSMKTGPGQQ